MLVFHEENQKKDGGRKHTDFEIKGDREMRISEASIRRDLTFNSLAYDPLTETVFDPFGGVEDIKQKKIDITNAEAFQEDPLRVLRIMQFAARFEFDVTDKAKKLCREMVERGDLDHLPVERVTEELKKLLLKGKRPSIGFEFAREVGIVEKYWPEMHALVGVQQEFDWHPEGDVWNHTMQVVDAAIEIAKREELSNEGRLVLALGAICHDLGKPSKTEFQDGKWRARGHEQAGVEPSRNFLSRFNIATHIKAQVLSLVPEHMNPKAYWDMDVNQGANMNKALLRMADRLQKNGGATMFLLGLLVESDQRGRNGEEQQHLARYNVANLDEWQGWFNQRITELQIVESAVDNLLDGKLLMHELGVKSGTWIGVLLKVVYIYQLNQEVRTQNEALAKAKKYFELFKKHVLSRMHCNFDDKKAYDYWKKIKEMEDPREVLNAE